MIFKNILEVPALIPAQFPYKIILFSIKFDGKLRKLIKIGFLIGNPSLLSPLGGLFVFGSCVGRSKDLSK